MLRDITLGQYYPAKSPVHGLDPRTKLFATILFLISLFINKYFVGYIYIILAFALVLRLAHIPFKYMMKGLKGILIILLLSVVINIFITPGQVVFSIWKLTVTVEGLKRAAFYGLRLVLLIMGSSVMTFTTTPTSLTDGLEKSMSFLRIFHFPVHDFAMMLGIALRFIPILSDEADKIIKAQEARGASFSGGGLFKKVKSMVPLLIPLLISAFRRAEELAMALDARCYNGNSNRTKLYPLRYSKNDKTAYIIILIYIAGLIGLNVVVSKLGWV